MALVDRERFRQRHRDPFEVGVPFAGPQVELDPGVLAPLSRFVAAELADRHRRFERQRRAVVGVEVGGEADHGALVADPLRVDGER